MAATDALAWRAVARRLVRCSAPGPRGHWRWLRGRDHYLPNWRSAVAAAEDVLLVEITDYVALLTLNRPAVLNAIDRHLAEALTRTVTALDRDPDVRVAILTGAGTRAFSAGADL